MPVKIRLMRIGTKHRPFYRVVAVDERRKRTGGYLDLIGTYNPLTNPKDIRINQEKLEEWKKKGAVLSHGFLRVLGNAPQKPARKAKKAKEEKAKEEPKADLPTEETPQEDAVEQPAEGVAPAEDTETVEETAQAEEAVVEEVTPEATEEEKS